ncbi:uncharacterized protein E5676_scaffold108G001060 [Cucumis melo var. makuwa]|uniref:DUF4218 domain-containing protein n=1 Tax=Cucumis melo var. makuwa TaxID=1194695 RepID=A0A5A7THV5_CUCMM|nr:uncharacterized protein E6C27_scaffold44G004000 [Cucumis melo var. makuwa]TYK05286.1 uncharacterized protein E5676_scaffold108G001060 [Cucumis melo var. makuwa]
MTHLVVHLPYEAKVTGPINYSWMYPIERSLRTLIQYIRNKSRPKGSIVEAYVMNESSIFRSRYLNGIETRFSWDERNDDNIPKDEIIGHYVVDHIEDNTLCRVNVYPTVVERSIVRHVVDNFINNGNMSNFLADFDESDDLFNFNVEECNIVLGTSSEQSLMNRVARVKQPYNHNSGAKSFLQWQHELTKQ